MAEPLTGGDGRPHPFLGGPPAPPTPALTSVPPRAARRRDIWARGLVVAKLGQLEGGHLRLIEPSASAPSETRLGRSNDLSATLEVHDPSFWWNLALGGSLGAAEGYMDGSWSSDDLTTLVRLLVRNREILEGLEGSWKWLGRPVERLRHLARANTRRGSQRNIAEHYDLSNDFFALFLDPQMMYSSAIFETPETTLDEASLTKLETLCTKLDLGSEDHLLEIGTGWGGLASYAARTRGCRITTATISQQQYDYARARLKHEGLDGQVEVVLRDYRDLEGHFDKLVSVEMIEAVGLERLPTYFRKCSELLRPGGLMALQAITIADRHYASAARSVDFIQRYIFPGSAIPSIGSMTAAVAAETDLTVVDLEDIGLSYARTLAAWRERFLARRDDVLTLGFDARFVRMWEYYFCYCEGGFLERAISDVHMVLAKPRWRGQLQKQARRTSKRGET